MGEQKNIAQQLKDLKVENTRLKKENDLKTAWISLLSHDFRGFFLNTNMLIEALYEESIAQVAFFKMLLELQKDCLKNLKTINNTGEWIKTQLNETELHKTDLYIVELFAKLKLTFAERLDQKKLHFKLIGDVSLKFNANQFLVSFILKEIVDNAIKYSHSGSAIFLKAEIKNNQIIVTIEDQGIGMSAMQLDQIFTFDAAVFQGTDGEVGAGLSLKIVRNFVYLADGVIEITSTLNKGTRVSILFPLN